MSHHGSIPYEYIPYVILEILQTRGLTIPDIEKTNSKRPGDKSQEKYRDSTVWHTKQALDISVAKRLKLDLPSLLGERRVTNDFMKATTIGISKLKKRGWIVDWNSNKRYAIWRLTNTADLPKIYLMMSKKPIPKNPETSNEMTRVFLEIMRKSKKDNTYKFALGKAILEYSRGTKSYENHSDGTHEIPYQYFADKFLEYYWHQECKFRMKQDFHKTKMPRVITEIRKIWSGNVPGPFDDLNSEDKKKASKGILDEVFGSIKSKKSIVIEAFQKTKINGQVAVNPIFYDYDNNSKILRLKPKAFEFFRNNNQMLENIVILEWAKFLERVNHALPMLISKIEKHDPKRGSLSKSKNLFLKHTCHCFYCNNQLKEKIHVDHFIPWSYLFSDTMWNLVLSCQTCNLKKHDSLPTVEFRDMLIDRNSHYQYQINDLERELGRLDTGKGWQIEIKNHYKHCLESGFDVIRDLP